ncbi:hypothetical protein [Intrasporangium flavum]|uniref:hypothetical protein n=1 Tax=Intrasporangium flavum TaxID=1428657 RepID=UPI00096D61CA|nr:hypothetical protein [Intrasporangium flavum]
MSSTTSLARDAWPLRGAGTRRATDGTPSLQAAARGSRQTWVAWGVLGLAVLADPPRHWTDATTRKEQADV